MGRHPLFGWAHVGESPPAEHSVTQECLTLWNPMDCSRLPCAFTGSLLNSIPPWLGHKGTGTAKVILLCVSWSVLPFVYVVLFSGIMTSGRIGVDSWLSIVFPAEMFYSFTLPSREAE